MTISDHDRKVLWARAHNACVICKRRLVHDAAPGDRESIVGDEAHKVARKPAGARARLRPDAELGSYDNLILLCKVDHQVVDDQPSAYPVERLQRIKADHERWADEQHGDPDPLPRCG